jgi:hypothetical protein
VTILLLAEVHKDIDSPVFAFTSFFTADTSFKANVGPPSAIADRSSLSDPAAVVYVCPFIDTSAVIFFGQQRFFFFRAHGSQLPGSQPKLYAVFRTTYLSASVVLVRALPCSYLLFVPLVA